MCQVSLQKVELNFHLFSKSLWEKRFCKIGTMPFITCDHNSRLVDDEEYVQKYNDYFIARKLYVWLDVPFSDDDVSLFSSVGKSNEIGNI